MAKAQAIRNVDVTSPLLATAARMIEIRLDELLSWEYCLQDVERVYDLHQMRIAAKRLRYTLEIFQEAYSTDAATSQTYGSTLEAVRSLQDVMGEIHDADVLVPGLIEQIAHLLVWDHEDRKREPLVGVDGVDLDGCAGLIAVCRETRSVRHRRFSQLLTSWRKLRDERLFEQLTAEIGDRARQAPLADVPATDPLLPYVLPKIAPQDADHEEESKVRAASGRRRAPSARRKSAPSCATKAPGHTGAGPNTGASTHEGGSE